MEKGYFLKKNEIMWIDETIDSFLKNYLSKCEMNLTLKIKYRNKIYTLQGLLKPMFEVFLRDYQDILIEDASKFKISDGKNIFVKENKHFATIYSKEIDVFMEDIKDFPLLTRTPKSKIDTHFYTNSKGESIKNVIDILKTLGLKEDGIWDL